MSVVLSDALGSQELASEPHPRRSGAVRSLGAESVPCGAVLVSVSGTVRLSNSTGHGCPPRQSNRTSFWRLFVEWGKRSEIRAMAVRRYWKETVMTAPKLPTPNSSRSPPPPKEFDALAATVEELKRHGLPDSPILTPSQVWPRSGSDRHAAITALTTSSRRSMSPRRARTLWGPGKERRCRPTWRHRSPA